MKRLLSLFVVLGTVACLASAAHAIDLIGGSTNNGYFDEAHPVLINPDTQLFSPQPNVWVYEGTTTIAGPYPDGLSLEPFANGSNTPQTNGGAGAPPRPEGCGADDCGVFFKAFSGNMTRGPITVNLYQDNPATPGTKYVLTGWAGAEANYMASATQLALEFRNAANATIGGQTVDLAAAGLFTANGQPFNYKQYMAMATAPAGTTTVRARVSMIGGEPNPAGGGQAFVVDDFRLSTAVPEPASVGLGLIAMLSLLAMGRRR